MSDYDSRVLMDYSVNHPLVILGPSGVGKSTFIKALTSLYPDSFGFSVSYTTREPRKNEKDGVDYFYITKKQFE